MRALSAISNFDQGLLELITFESDDYNTAFARTLEEENKLIKTGLSLFDQTTRKK